MIVISVFVFQQSHSFVPMIFFGACSILAGGLALLLPETKDKKLAQHLDEVKGRVENNEYAITCSYDNCYIIKPFRLCLN